MKVKIFVVLLLLPFMLMPVMAQQSSITVINTKCPDNTYLSFGRPIDSNPAHFMQAADFFIFNNGIATKRISWDKSVFILITGNEYCPKQRIILCPGDSILIHVDNGNLIFGGTNAAGNNLLKEQNLLASGAVHIDDALKNSSLERIVSGLEDKKQKLFAPICELYENHKISKDFFDFSSKEFDMVFCHAIRGRIHHTGLTEDEQKKVLCTFYAKYNPFDSKYAGTSMRLGNMSIVSRLMSEGYLSKGDIHPTGLWDEGNNIRNICRSIVRKLILPMGYKLEGTSWELKAMRNMLPALNFFGKSFP